MNELAVEPVSVALTRAEYAQAAMRMGSIARRMGAWPARARLLGYIRVWILPVLVVAGLKAFQPSVTNGAVAGLFLVLLIASICFYGWLAQSGYLYRWLPREDGSGLRPHTIAVSETGMFIKSELTSTQVHWAAIKQVDDHAGLILVFLDRASAMTIPRRAFQDQAAADHFVEAVRARIDRPSPPSTDAYGPSGAAKWISRIVLGLIALLIVVHLIEWFAAGP